MDVARDVIELFSVKDSGRAREIASKLNQLNGDRQEQERRILAAIHERIESEPALRDAFCMVIDGEGWHRGVIGITATRVVERYGRPTLIISRDGDNAHGSGRSIPAFHLLNALESCGHLFSRYGGHAHAVGFSLPAAAVPELCRHLDLYARDHLRVADFEPVLKVEAELPLDYVTPELYQALCSMEPFGVGNPDPIFVARDVRLMSPPQIMKDKHIKLRLAPAVSDDGADEGLNEIARAVMPRCHPDSAALPRRNGNWRKAIMHNALGWHMAERFQQARCLPGDALDIAFTVGQNEHPDFGGIELSLRDFKLPKNEESKAKVASAADGVAIDLRRIPPRQNSKYPPPLTGRGPPSVPVAGNNPTIPRRVSHAASFNAGSAETSSRIIFHAATFRAPSGGGPIASDTEHCGQKQIRCAIDFWRGLIPTV